MHKWQLPVPLGSTLDLQPTTYHFLAAKNTQQKQGKYKKLISRKKKFKTNYGK